MCVISVALFQCLYSVVEKTTENKKWQFFLLLVLSLASNLCSNYWFTVSIVCIWESCNLIERKEGLESENLRIPILAKCTKTLFFFSFPSFLTKCHHSQFGVNILILILFLLWRSYLSFHMFTWQLCYLSPRTSEYYSAPQHLYHLEIFIVSIRIYWFFSPKELYFKCTMNV